MSARRHQDAAALLPHDLKLRFVPGERQSLHGWMSTPASALLAVEETGGQSA
ncbi:hypothetical protein [Breoghania sp.]|uniref:hypothetical protein n=1 Tax=Breoghania sp. TaxID=2065378 RepID=UPI002AAB94D5|nr:hypothetical protein [Breoghania sp.]